ncbi:MAG: CRISPR-associated protein Cse2 family [Roseomonas sp.]|nr:CRISPR-associated protein Cse2 family [Roseomonas sp.]
MSLDRKMAVAATCAWWRDLQPDPATQRPGDRAALARLRRCALVSDAMQESATIALFRRCRADDPRDLVPVALAAAVLAHLRVDKPPLTVARLVGPESSDKPETALLKPLRFRRLMEAAGADERLTAFRRLVALAKGELHLTDLAAALLFWNEERRRRWTYDYWNAGLPAALLTPQSQETVG